MCFTSKQHTFAVCAYKESPYLEKCVLSLLGQTEKSSVIITTSTPNDYIERIAEQYHLPVLVNKGEYGIAGDWNFAYSCADTPLVTLAHQDDVYEPNYTKKVLERINNAEHPLIAFTDYDEIRGEQRIHNNTLLRIKRILLLPLRFKPLQKNRFVRRFSLSWGCGISCPSVMFVRPNLPCVIFKNGYRSDVDWEDWELLSKMTGEFIYTPAPLVLHRIHVGSETSAVLADAQRGKEDYEMFCKFWPPLIAKLMTKLYRFSEKSNQLLD